MNSKHYSILGGLFAVGVLTVASCSTGILEKKSEQKSTSSVRGDLNHDGKVDVKDFALAADLGKFNKPASISEGDVNADGIFDTLDIAAMLAGVDDSASIVGDANRDGKVDILDASQVLAAGKFGTGESASWEQGDFTGDGKVTDDDMSLLQASIRQASNPVPGDCTGDGRADGADIGKFMIRYDNVPSGATWLDCDFNGDGIVDIMDASDITSGVVQISFAKITYGDQPSFADAASKPPRPGDANGDGKVDEADAVQIMGGGKYDKGNTGATWSDGDFNGDHMVDILDMAEFVANRDATTRKPGDANGDGKLDAVDIAQILAAGKWDNGAATFEQGDFNGDGVFDILDWSLVLASGVKFE